MHLALGQNTQRAVILVNNYRLLGSRRMGMGELGGVREMGSRYDCAGGNLS